MRTRITNRRVFLVLVAGVVFIPLAAIGAPELVVNWYTIDGGGVQSSTGGNIELNGTIGQFDAKNQPMVGGNLKVTGGFWVIPQCPSIPADYDADCDVDQADYQVFDSCASGPGVPHGGGCEETDFDGDADTDQGDFATFQRCFSGENNPADPNCAD